MEYRENDYAYWLDNVHNVGRVSARKIIDNGYTCKDIFEMSSKELAKYLPAGKVRNIELARKSWDFERENKRLKELGIRFIPFTDEEFPEKLKNIDNPPFGIYVKGLLPDPDVPSVAVIGARMCSEYGRFMARQFGQGLAMSGVQVISGMARGVDGISQNAALEAGGKSFGVLGCGADICYPDENRDVYNKLIEKGGIISEYPPGTQPVSNFFPMRNRIISALSDVVLVVEARQKSGTSITVDTALEQGREVLAVPGRVTDRLSDGCNYLISQGAGIAMTVEDVLDRLWSIKNCSAQTSKSFTEKAEGESSQAKEASVKQKPEESSRAEEACDKQKPEESSRAEEACDKQKPEESSRTEEACDIQLKDEPLEADKVPDIQSSRELTLSDEILDIIDIIPVSMSAILEELYRRGKNVTIPILMTELMDMTGSGKVLQNGAYYRKPGVIPPAIPKYIHK